MMKSVFQFLLIALFPVTVLGQEKSIPINISIFNEATAIPFTRFFTTPIHPGIQLGTEFNYNTKEHSRLFQTANLSYFYHNHLDHSYALSSEIAYEYRIKSALAFTGLFGLGYMQTFNTSEEFKLTNGQYEKHADWGNARLYPSLSLDIGYYLKSQSKTSPKIFLRYQSWVEYPFSPDFIPAMTHINLYLGYKFFIPTNNSKK